MNGQDAGVMVGAAYQHTVLGLRQCYIGSIEGFAGGLDDSVFARRGLADDAELSIHVSPPLQRS
ncbi:hypothetical protein SDC9_116696 [bioreactor metagenome]|uniref:Uncharacterized protein n=1 Tax=bioreactor metagenome TaxID=1076179 RepID=A0A645BXB7_9ZZZZ